MPDQGGKHRDHFNKLTASYSHLQTLVTVKFNIDSFILDRVFVSREKSIRKSDLVKLKRFKDLL